MAETGLKSHYAGNCARRIADMLQPHVPGLDREEYAAAVDARIPELELKDRVLVLAEELRSRLPEDYVTAVGLIVASLGPELREDQGMFTDSWYLMPTARFIEEYGLEHPEVSLEAIEEVTRRYTGEHAIRPFLEHWPEQTMATVQRWAHSKSHNVRRLASEGIRPRLPWASQYKPFREDPRPVVAIIDALIADESGFVRTSVANNLNDIAKDHPEFAVATARRWLSENQSPATRWIVTKGLRTLVKQGDPAALETLGVRPDPHLRITELTISPTDPRIGEKALVSAMVTNAGSEERDVVVDYQIHFLRPSGKLLPTTFRLGKATVPAGASVVVQKQHSFREVKTRSLHVGEHTLAAQVNGTKCEQIGFRLRLARS